MVSGARLLVLRPPSDCVLQGVQGAIAVPAKYFDEGFFFSFLYLTRSLGFLKLLGQKSQQLANFGSVSSSTALSLISLIRSLSAADWDRMRSDTEASSPGSFASSAVCSSVKVIISKPLLFDIFWSASSSSSTASWLSR